MSKPDPIRTLRLTLIPLTALELKEYLNGSVKDFPELSKENLSEELSRAIQMKIDKLEVAPAGMEPWITYWLIRINADGIGGGLIGFKGAPDQEGQVEIGYGIDPGYRNRGYMTEAVQALTGWAFGDKRCNRIVAPDTLRSNPASNRVLQKSGFSISDQTEDTISWVLKKDQTAIAQ